VTRGFAGMKFSGSPNILGANREMVIRRAIKIEIPIKSFVV